MNKYINLITGFLSNANNIFTLLAALAASYAGFISLSVDKKFDEVDSQMKTIKLSEVQTDLKDKYYTKVADLLNSKDTLLMWQAANYATIVLDKDTTIQKQLLNVIINYPLTPENLKNSLRKVLGSINNEMEMVSVNQQGNEVKNIIAENNIENTDKSCDDLDFPLVKIEIFYNESTIQKAELLKKYLAEFSNHKKLGIVEMTQLDDLVNARPGYNVFENQIRFHASESKMAEAIVSCINVNYNLNQLHISYHLAKQVSENYISIFIVK